MKTLSYSTLQSKYYNFADPQAVIEMNGKDFTKNKENMIITDLEVELTSDYEASIATFRIYNCYDINTGIYRYEAVKDYVMLGASLCVKIGYYGQVTDIFLGFISKIHFIYEKGDMPCIEIIGMDIKGIMMANRYSRQLKAASYGEAVKEILNQPTYRKLIEGKAVSALQITDTPDKKPESSSSKASAETVEMVAESDYEFVVKAARKFNYEFFSVCGTVLFRRAKNDTSSMISLGMDQGLLNFDIGYDISGLVETIEARSVDAGRGKVIVAKQKLKQKITNGQKVSGLIKKSVKVYVDPTIASQAQAAYRAQSLMETVSYRLGTLSCECVGIPELVPGRFIDIVNFESPAANRFYVTHVIHSFHENGYRTKLTGKAAEISEKGA